MIADRRDHLLPVVAVGTHLPTERLCIRKRLAKNSSLVHQLFGDATNVDAGPSEAPGGARGGGLDEIEARDFGAQFGSLLGGSLFSGLGLWGGWDGGSKEVSDEGGLG